MKKLNLSNINTTELTARLYCLIRNFQNQFDLVARSEDEFKTYLDQLVSDNFEVIPSQAKPVAQHLGLFLLGNNNNQFSKVLGL